MHGTSNPSAAKRSAHAGASDSPRSRPRTREAISSYAYRLFTLADALGFVILGIKSMQDTPFLTASSSAFFNELAKLLAGLVVPGYLLWRNGTTWRAGQPMLSERLLVVGPWYFRAAIWMVWLQIAATLVLPIANRIVAGDVPIMPGRLAYDLNQWWSAALWFGGPAIFVIELCVAMERGRAVTAKNG